MNNLAIITLVASLLVTPMSYLQQVEDGPPPSTNDPGETERVVTNLSYVRGYPRKYCPFPTTVSMKVWVKPSITHVDGVQFIITDSVKRLRGSTDGGGGNSLITTETNWYDLAVTHYAGDGWVFRGPIVKTGRPFGWDRYADLYFLYGYNFDKEANDWNVWLQWYCDTDVPWNEEERDPRR